MLNKFTPAFLRLAASVLLLVFCMLTPHAQAAVVSDDFTKDADNNDWTALGYACLTARGTSTAASKIPACTNPAVTETSGSGALRLTPSNNYYRGGIVSNYTFPTNQGLQVTFTTYTFGGDSGGTAGLGADGMSFFLMDGSVGVTLGSGANAVSNLGGSGGALSYSCSNTNSTYSGLTGAYLGLGMDEYGNFLNKDDNTSTGIDAQTTSASTNGYNTWQDTNHPKYQPNRIGLRGAGNVSWYWLNQNYPLLYPSSLGASAQETAVKATCSSGFLYDYGSAASQTITSATVSGTTMTVAVPNAVRNTNGDSVTISGTITAANPVQNITSPSVSGTTLTFTASGGSYAVGNGVTIGGTITGTPATQAITSFSNFSNTNKTVRANMANTSIFTAGDFVYISGINSAATYPNNTWYSISQVFPSYLLLSASSTGTTFNSTLPTVTSSSSGNPGKVAATASSIAGTYTTISGTTGSTVKVTLSTSLSGGSVSNTSGNVTLTPPTVTGNYTISNVTSTGFDVTLPSTATTITNTSGSALDTTIPGNSGRRTTTTVANYAAIPGGYWVLPNSQPMAKQTAANRTQATPITYKLMITPTGSLNFLYSYNGGAYQQVLTNWPITSANGPMPSTFRFGFTGATGGSRNYHDITCFLAEPVTSASGAGGNAVQSGQFKTSTQLYIASYDSYFWTGSVTALPIVTNSAGVVGVGTATWDGNCALTGGGCATTGATSTTLVGPSDRQILTWNGTQGVPFQWSASTSTSTLSAAQQTVLNSTDSAGQNRLNWLRGDRTQEQIASPPGLLRARAGVLGDVVDSSPTWVGPPSINYGSAIADTLYSSAGTESSHATYNTTLATRLNVVYVGGNDGILHGFRTGRNYADGTYNGTDNDGKEVLGFVPSTVLGDSRVVGLTSPGYGHDYFADASPGFGDLYYGGAWHTWLVSGIGPGGKEIFALDITNPEDAATTGSTKFLEANAANIVKGDWTPAALTALTCVNATTNCGNNLGNTYGTPIIRRLHNGQWAIIFGNGYASTNGRAGVFIGLVAPTTTTSPAVTAGSVSFYWLDTGSTATGNGIAYVSSADLDGDHVTDYLYAGDLQGKLWRFDLTSSKPADWAVSKFGQTTGTPLYDAGSTHPITTQIATTVIALSGLGQRVMLGFGTGQGVPFTTSSGETYASGTQSLYGIWDWDMTGWNNGRTTSPGGVVIAASTTKYAALTQLATSGATVIAKTDLLTTTTTTTGSTRSAQIATVCWQGAANCTTGTNNKYGWVYDFPDTNEQLIFSPKFEGGALVVNTTIPAGGSVTGQCTPITTTGWSMALNMASGGGFTTSSFADSTGSFALTSTGAANIGIKQNSVGQPYFFTSGSKRYLASPDVGGGADVNEFKTGSSITVKRLSWEQIR